MSRSTAKIIGALAMSNETPENRVARATSLRKAADECETKAHAEEDAGNGEEAIALRAQAHRQRNLAVLVEPKKPPKKTRRGD